MTTENSAIVWIHKPEEEDMKTITELPKSIKGKGKVKGINFEQVAASPRAYIYACMHEKQELNTNPYYEVFKRKNVPVCVDFEKRIYSETEFKETYPNAEQFGSSAWCIWNKEQAFEKFKELSITEAY